MRKDVQPRRRPWGSWFHPEEHQPWLQVPPCSCRQHQHPGKKRMVPKCNYCNKTLPVYMVSFIISQEREEFVPSSEAQTRSLQLHVCWFHLHTCWKTIIFTITSAPFIFCFHLPTWSSLHYQEGLSCNHSLLLKVLNHVLHVSQFSL